jgi:acyl carrier protein
MSSSTTATDGLEARLETCFLTVFPDLPAANVQQATVDSVEKWDSLATVTLVAVIEEEFGIEIDFKDDLESFVSFQGIARYLSMHLG